ncbi:MAG: phosphotransferase family protein, partial [Rhodospirillaceae bacterium]|nr:phosphotransferase family protein [Rhodospirillaceae bacterium]
MSANIDREDVLAAMRGIDVFKDVPAEAIKTERLGGLTNRNFRIESPLGRHVLRIPGAGTSEYINRHNEAHAAKSAARVGVNAEVQHFDEKTGVMLCRYIDGGVTLNAERFKDLGSVRRSAVALRRVHDSAAPFL